MLDGRVRHVLLHIKDCWGGGREETLHKLNPTYTMNGQEIQFTIVADEGMAVASKLRLAAKALEPLDRGGHPEARKDLAWTTNEAILARLEEALRLVRDARMDEHRGPLRELVLDRTRPIGHLEPGRARCVYSMKLSLDEAAAVLGGEQEHPEESSRIVLGKYDWILNVCAALGEPAVADLEEDVRFMCALVLAIPHAAPPEGSEIAVFETAQGEDLPCHVAPRSFSGLRSAFRGAASDDPVLMARLEEYLRDVVRRHGAVWMDDGERHFLPLTHVQPDLRSFPASGGGDLLSAIRDKVDHSAPERMLWFYDEAWSLDVFSPDAALPCVCNAVSGLVVLVEMPRALHRLIRADRVDRGEDVDPRIAGVYELAARAHEGRKGG